MYIDEQITGKINEIKQITDKEAQSLINSTDGQANMISVNAVRTMRMSILRNFQILNGKLPLMIKEDIQTGLTGDMGGLISELRNLRGELADATREQEFITGHWKELKERNRKIKSGRG